MFVIVALAIIVCTYMVTFREDFEEDDIVKVGAFALLVIILLVIMAVIFSK